MRSKWVLSGTHEEGRYAYQGGGLYPTHLLCPEPQLPPSASSSSSSSSSLSSPYLPFYLRNVGMHGDQRWREEGKRDEGEESPGADRPALHTDTFSRARVD
ncbi:unnamed protein product [Pleuronectes platessa]|uniref:Uncharacterized protein n=1 Tax=Pleuronectes platessa TaxID=8262 RepID=A0A9N7VTI9_PLEPL|nr:unnamed protein product [Pleuronectes platessa]